MRLWSIHPEYLDAKGLVACWREALLAKKVLLGETEGYRYHPQLERFRATADPPGAIDAYLHVLWEESKRRGYSFDKGKYRENPMPVCIPVTAGQLRFELEHLKAKLSVRDPSRYRDIADLVHPRVHPLFTEVSGAREDWEKG